MKINYITLHNIGPYVGKHTFILDTNSSKNVILIGGKNGAGKTSFLRGMKYGLFGSFALGLKNETDKYFTEIKSLINNKAKNDYYVEISFDYIENFETKNYIMKRSWRRINYNLEEKLEIKCGDLLLDNLECKEVSDKLRAMTSPQLINSFIFDGEKISGIIEDGKIASYLEETFNSIFSIDLITQTRRDLENYLSKKAYENQSKDQIESINLITKINTIKAHLKTMEGDLQSQKATLANLVTMKKANSDNFYKLGGITKAQQEAYSKKIDSFNKEKEVMNQKIRAYVESDLPLYMCRDLLDDVVSQCKAERQIQYPKLLKEIEEFVGMRFPEVEAKLAKSVFDVNCIHKLELPDVEYIRNRINESSTNTLLVKPYLNNKVTKTDEYKLIKKVLINNENIDTINTLMEENKKLDVSIREMEQAIKNTESSIANLNEDLEVSYSIYEKMKDEIKKSSLYDSSFLIGKSALDLCELFTKSIVKSKLKKISSTALEIFNDTIRKADFITELSISHDFELKLKNAKGTIINPKTLSAGEMQILVSSLIWAMFRISGRREMFIFDTPLARLDKENRCNFITKIVSTISSQVIILSTDSEFVGDNLLVIEPNVFKKYLLEYNVDESATTVTEKYFGGDLR